MAGELKTIYDRKTYNRWLTLEVAGVQFEVEATWSAPTRKRFRDPENDDGYLMIDGIYIKTGKHLSDNLYDYLSDWCKASIEEKAWETLLNDEDEREYDVVKDIPW